MMEDFSYLNKIREGIGEGCINVADWGSCLGVVRLDGEKMGQV